MKKIKDTDVNNKYVHVVRPVDENSIWQVFCVQEMQDDGDTRGFIVRERYLTGHGYLSPGETLPLASQNEVRCSISHDSGAGFEVNLRSGTDNEFDFDESFSEEERRVICTGWNGENDEDCYSEGWVFEGDHSLNLDVTDAYIIVRGPFLVDRYDETSGKLVESEVSLK